jgi:hypothetical protein
MKRIETASGFRSASSNQPCHDLAAEEFPKESRLFLLAQGIATGTPAFFTIKEAGDGDKASNTFMARLRHAALMLFGTNYSEMRVCRDAKFALDFYFPDEATAVEMALSLRNSSSEYERDIFKCLLAIEEGSQIRHLVFITKPGGHFRQQRPGALAIATYVSKKFGLEIEIRELNDGWENVKAAMECVAKGQLMRSMEEKGRSLSAERLCTIISAVLQSPSG